MRKSPVLSGEAVGPRRITVGKEAAYEINMQNAGDVPADEVVVLVNVPAWADVAGAEATAGAARAPQMGNTAEPLRWNLGRMEAKSHEKLTLRLVPRQSRPFDLSLRWDYKPVAMSAATIEVQEPKLAMRLEGPREVHFGHREVYKLKLANSGTGPAENVVITLLPVAAGENQPAPHRIGPLAAGEERSIEVELTARQSGTLTIQVEARGDNGLIGRPAGKGGRPSGGVAIGQRRPGRAVCGHARPLPVRLGTRARPWPRA